jgi:hypothetical protein
MATATAKRENKTTFIREYLTKAPTASPAKAQVAWPSAGRAGSISSTLVSNVRKELGLAGNIRRARSTTTVGGAARTEETARPTRGRATAPRGSATRTGTTSKPRTQGKSAFIKEVLVDNAQATVKIVNEAWSKAGMNGTISDTLVSNIRSELGLTGNLRKKAGTAAKKAAKAAPTIADAPVARGRRSDRDRLLAEVEGDFDRLIFKLMVVGGMEKVEDDLRRARRHVVRSHKA